MAPKPKAFVDWPEKQIPIPYGPGKGWAVAVDRVVDGDTFNGFAAVGPPWGREYLYVSIRINELNKPESWQPGGAEATRELEAVLPRDTPTLCYVTKASFGRWTADVTLSDGTNLLSLIKPTPPSLYLARIKEQADTLDSMGVAIGDNPRWWERLKRWWK